MNPDPSTVRCPECHAGKGKPCVYLWPKDWDGTPRIRHALLSPAMLAKMDRAGKPTKRPHTARWTRARAKEAAAQAKAREAERIARAEPRDAVLRANAQAVACEQRQLIEWLREHAPILTGGAG